MSFRVGGKAGPLVGIVAEDILAAGRLGVVVAVGVREQRWAGNKKKAVAAAVAVDVAVGSVVAAAAAAEIVVVTGDENEKLNVSESAAAGVDGGARNEASMRPWLRLEVGKKSSSRRPGQLGSGQRQTGQNMNKSASDFGRRPGCGTS